MNKIVLLESNLLFLDLVCDKVILYSITKKENDMDALFPINKNVKRRNIISLVITILLYIALGVVMTVLQKLLGAIPIVNNVMSILGVIVWGYCLIGVIFAFIKFLK